MSFKCIGTCTSAPSPPWLTRGGRNSRSMPGFRPSHLSALSRYTYQTNHASCLASCSSSRSALRVLHAPFIPLRFSPPSRHNSTVCDNAPLCAGFPALTGIYIVVSGFAVAGFPVLAGTVAGVRSIAGVPAIVSVPVVAGLPYCCSWWSTLHNVPSAAGVPILMRPSYYWLSYIVIGVPCCS